MGVIFLFSAQDAAISQGQSDFFAAILGTATGNADQSVLSFITRKAAHTFLYLVLGVLAYNAVRTRAIPRKRVVLISIAIALGYAILDEAHQLFIPGRSGEVRDVAIDALAAAMGVLLYVLLEKWYTLRKIAK